MVVRYSLSSSNEDWYKVWAAVFKSCTWLDKMVSEYQLNPLLLGNREDFESVIRSSALAKTKPYLQLIIYDWGGDAQYSDEELHKTLHEGTRTTEGYELENGITLNILDAIAYRLDQDHLEYTSKLFTKGLDLSYVFWKDESKKVGHLSREHIAIPTTIGRTKLPLGSITTDGEILKADWSNANHPNGGEDMCLTFALRLDLPNGKPFNLWFTLHPIERESFWHCLQSNYVYDALEDLEKAQSQFIVSRL
jgi:hypothetical protein